MAISIGGASALAGVTRKDFKNLAMMAVISADRYLGRVQELADNLPDALATAINATPEAVGSELAGKFQARLAGYLRDAGFRQD
ncbi:MAG: hypothetical protein LBU38_03960 [Propionibacteriaceae bacterium]|nr:hypothetical protein [Propionibacteriaceae bacterium]